MVRMSFVRSGLARAALLAPLALVSAPRSAQSAGISADFFVGAQLGGSCAVGSSGIDFGRYDPVVLHSTLPLPGVGNLDVSCTLGAPAVVTLGQGVSPGTGSTGAAPVRRLSNGDSHLAYALYRDVLHTQPWGDTVDTGAVLLGTGSSLPIPVYGSVPAAQNVAPGSYNDTVVITVTF